MAEIGRVPVEKTGNIDGPRENQGVAQMPEPGMLQGSHPKAGEWKEQDACIDISLVTAGTLSSDPNDRASGALILLP